MPLAIDASHPFRFPSELQRLAATVRDADPVDESDWIEWKSQITLLTPTADIAVVRNIIGFANREPSVAARYAGGYAYLLLGVAPGDVQGVDLVDPAKLIPRVRPMLGERITWRTEPVTLDGKNILVIVVDPPSNGDPIHALRRDMGKYREGTVFVRRIGQVEQATQHELDMLARRASIRHEQLEIQMFVKSDTIERWPEIREALEAWAGREEEYLLGIPRVTNPPPPGVFEVPDTRSPEDYKAEVLDYLRKAKAEMQASLEAEVLHHHAPVHLRLIAHNPTEKNFSAVRIQASVLGDVLAYSSNVLQYANPLRSLPDRPPAPGMPIRRDSDWTGMGIGMGMRDIPPDNRWSVRELENGLQIEYFEFELRAEDTVEMPPVPLKVEEESGTALTCCWGATAKGTIGRVKGTLSIEMAEPTAPFEEHLELILRHRA